MRGSIVLMALNNIRIKYPVSCSVIEDEFEKLECKISSLQEQLDLQVPKEALGKEEAIIDNH